MMFEKLVRILKKVIVLAILVLCVVNIVRVLTYHEFTSEEIMDRYVLENYGSDYHGKLMYDDEEDIMILVLDEDGIACGGGTLDRDYYNDKYNRGS